MNRTISIFLTCISLCLAASAQDLCHVGLLKNDPTLSQVNLRACTDAEFHRTDSALYMPLDRNNLWRYYQTQEPGWPGMYVTCRVYDSLNINQIAWWQVNYIRFGISELAVDTLRLMSSDTLTWLRERAEWVLYRFNAALGDTWRYPEFVLADTFVWRVTTYLGELDSFYIPQGPMRTRLFRHVKVFFSEVPQFPDGWVYTVFAPNLGIVYTRWQFYFQFLYGAIISDTLYGDTTIVSVLENAEFPQKLALEQNCDVWFFWNNSCDI